MQARSPSSKIFGIGAHKTGTTSLSVALEILGFTCSHWNEFLLIRKDIKRENYRLKVLERFDAITDLPIPAIYHELDKEYPGSKFILTVRDPDAWVGAVKAHLENTSKVLNRRGLSFIFEEYLFYKTWKYDEQNALERFSEHNREVVEYFAKRPNDLLIMNITKGDEWQLLCPFLNVPKPSVSFPHRRL